jgi:hypothetical protein
LSKWVLGIFADLDCYLEFCNRQRAHQGCRTQSRTPCQVLLDELNQIPSLKQFNKLAG